METKKSYIEISQNIGKKRKHAQDSSYEILVQNNKKSKAKDSDVLDHVKHHKKETNKNINEVDPHEENIIPVISYQNFRLNLFKNLKLKRTFLGF
jgi:hypothetical protein